MDTHMDADLSLSVLPPLKYLLSIIGIGMTS